MDIEGLIFVCDYRNTRSPAAEAMAIKMARAADLNLQISSAALKGLANHTSSEMAIAVQQLGYQFVGPNPRSRLVTEGAFTAGDLILSFEKRQVDKIKTIIKDPAVAVYTLPEFAGFPDEEIPEPPTFIKETIWSSATRCIPIKRVRLPVYRMIGYSHPADYDGVLDVHARLARRIERYVEKAIARIAQERAA